MRRFLLEMAADQLLHGTHIGDSEEADLLVHDAAALRCDIAAREVHVARAVRALHALDIVDLGVHERFHAS